MSYNFVSSKFSIIKFCYYFYIVYSIAIASLSILSIITSLINIEVICLGLFFLSPLELLESETRDYNTNSSS